MATRTAGGICYTLTRKAVKNLSLRVRSDGSVAVSAPKRVPAVAVDAFVLRHAGLIAGARERLAARPGWRSVPEQLLDGGDFWLWGKRFTLVLGAEGAPRRDGDRLLLPWPGPLPYTHPGLTRWLKGELRPVAEAALESLVPVLEARYHRSPTELLLRNTRSRYGSCRPATGVITLSSRLVHFPPEAVETVLAHELAHLVAADHSAAFYAAAEELLPGYRERARLLK